MLQKAAHLEMAKDVTEAASTAKKHILKVFGRRKKFSDTLWTFANFRRSIGLD